MWPFAWTPVRIALDDVSWHGHRRTIELVGGRGALRSAHSSRYSIRVDYQSLRRMPNTQFSEIRHAERSITIAISRDHYATGVNGPTQFRRSRASVIGYRP